MIDSARAGTLGINPESPAAIIGVVVFSVLLAIGVWLRPAAGPILVAAATFGVVTGVFDGREVVVQIGRADRLLVVLAALITALHLGVAAVAVAMMRRTIGSAVRLERQT
ncbi:MAG: hypothetical protein IT305_08255 [Chloroflexi bacterium]|nr:hypothetical protein [Chloroflexota bacterium]